MTNAKRMENAIPIRLLNPVTALKMAVVPYKAVLLPSLCSLLLQNLKKGSKGMAEMLSYEVGQAFEERKNLAKRFGEEAGTKLLFPMILMLVIVMVVLIIPAFLSF